MTSLHTFNQRASVSIRGSPTIDGVGQEIISMSDDFDGTYLVECAFKVRIPDILVKRYMQAQQGEMTPPDFCVKLNTGNDSPPAVSVMYPTLPGLYYGSVYTVKSLTGRHTVSANLLSTIDINGLEVFDSYIKAEKMGASTSTNISLAPPPAKTARRGRAKK